MSFAAIMFDPPWAERGGGGRGADAHYDVMDRAEILATMLRAPCWDPADNAHGYCWTTMTSLPDGLWLLDALGFRYVTHAVWVKIDPADMFGQLDTGLGQYFRGAHELLLFGVRGDGYAVRSEHRGIPSVIAARTPRAPGGGRIHSRKPAEFYDLVERRTVGARLEMFARVARPGWTAWGNEAPQPAQEQSA